MLRREAGEERKGIGLEMKSSYGSLVLDSLILWGKLKKR